MSFHIVSHRAVGRSLAMVTIACLAALSSNVLVGAQDLPSCEDQATASECRLPGWPEAAQRDVPSPFGVVDGVVWLEDSAGDAPAGGLDILALGIGSVDIADAGSIRDLDGLLKLGKAKEAVRPGQNVLVRVVVDRPLAEVADGHASIHVTTDRDRSRSNNAPAGVEEGQQPFAGAEDVYTTAFATTTGETALLDSDLASGWYDDEDPFAAAWASPTVLDLLLRPEALGDDLGVVTYTSAADGGYDSLSLGTGPVPLDGVVGLRPTCLEASLAGEPFVVTRLEENGQTLRDVEAPASWRGGAGFRLDAASLEAMRAFLAAADDDDDGRVALPASVNLFEDGTVIGQRPDLWLALDDDQLQLALELGLMRRGYEVLRAIDPGPTGDAVVDPWLEGAVDAFVEAIPPFRSGKKAGELVGEAPGSCVPALAHLWGPVTAAGPGEGSPPPPSAAPS